MQQFFELKPPFTRLINPFAVMRRDGSFLLTATEQVAAGLPLFLIAGVENPAPTFASVQVGPDLHIDMDPAIDLLGQMDIYPWRFMNHSCDPNCAIIDRMVVAIMPIHPGDELTFDYNSNEDEMAQPFECDCGAAQCAGWISGRAHASP
jgi:SET domain